MNPSNLPGALQLAAIVEADKKIHVNDASCKCFSCGLNKSIMQAQQRRVIASTNGRQRMASQIQRDHPYVAPPQAPVSVITHEMLVHQVDWLSNEVAKFKTWLEVQHRELDALTRSVEHERQDLQRQVANLQRQVEEIGGLRPPDRYK